MGLSQLLGLTALVFLAATWRVLTERSSARRRAEDMAHNEVMLDKAERVLGNSRSITSGITSLCSAVTELSDHSLKQSSVFEFNAFLQETDWGLMREQVDLLRRAMDAVDPADAHLIEGVIAFLGQFQDFSVVTCGVPKNEVHGPEDTETPNIEP